MPVRSGIMNRGTIAPNANETADVASNRPGCEISAPLTIWASMAAKRPVAAHKPTAVERCDKSDGFQDNVSETSEIIEIHWGRNCV